MHPSGTHPWCCPLRTTISTSNSASLPFFLGIIVAFECINKLNWLVAYDISTTTTRPINEICPIYLEIQEIGFYLDIKDVDYWFFSVLRSS